MLDLLLREGGSTMMYEQTYQVIRGDYLKEGKQVPFVIIPQW